MIINGVEKQFSLAYPKELTFGEDCHCGRGKIPYWEGKLIYPYCGACALDKDSAKAKREQRQNEEAAKFKGTMPKEETKETVKLKNTKEIKFDIKYTGDLNRKLDV